MHFYELENGVKTGIVENRETGPWLAYTRPEAGRGMLENCDYIVGSSLFSLYIKSMLPSILNILQGKSKRTAT